MIPEYVRIIHENDKSIQFSLSDMADPDSECGHLKITGTLIQETTYKAIKYVMLTRTSGVTYGKLINPGLAMDLVQVHNVNALTMTKVSLEEYESAMRESLT